MRSGIYTSAVRGTRPATRAADGQVAVGRSPRQRNQASILHSKSGQVTGLRRFGIRRQPDLICLPDGHPEGISPGAQYSAITVLENARHWPSSRAIKPRQRRSMAWSESSFARHPGVPVFVIAELQGLRQNPPMSALLSMGCELDIRPHGAMRQRPAGRSRTWQAASPILTQ